MTGLINQELLLKNEYLEAENPILRAHLPASLRLSDPERPTLAEIAKRLGREALAQVACVAKPDTILAWYRKLIAKKFDGSKHRSYPGRPSIEPKLEDLIVKMARENSGWGYDRIVGALSNQTAGNVLKRHVIAPPKRSQTTTWKEFIESHLAVLAGMQQMARNATEELWGFRDQRRYILHDRDTKFCSQFRATLAAGGIKPIQLPARSQI